MISLSCLSFAYPHQPALFEDFTWQVADGQSWAVLGASGCGKTTLFYLPAILTALRQSVGTAIAVLYIAESLATQRGLGLAWPSST